MKQNALRVGVFAYPSLSARDPRSHHFSFSPIRNLQLRLGQLPAPCLYIDRKVLLSSSNTFVNEPPLAFLKPARKSGESEVRAVWHPTIASDALTAIITECPQLVGLAEMLTAA